MLSLGSSDTNNCVMYLENYLDCVENLPDDLQKHLSRMRELDVNYQGFLRDIETLAAQYDECVNLKKVDERYRLLRKAQSTLISAQELGDKKLQIIQQLQDLIENKTRSLDNDYRNIDNGSKERENVLSSNSVSVNSSSAVSNSTSSIEIHHKDQSVASVSVSSSNNGNNEQRQSKRVRRGRGDTDIGGSGNEYGSSGQHHHHHYGEHGGSIPMPRVTATLLINNQKKHSRDSNATNTKKKKRKTNKQGQKVSMQKEDDSRSSSRGGINDDDDEDQSIDPDEPTYCLCDQISYGEMICCDNDLCPIEWFHFSCVSLSTKPKGKWFCPKCRGDRPNVMKPKAQFLKELERYNREKEEKARSY